MDLTFDILLFLHLTALVVGASINVAMPIAGRLMPTASPETRAAFGAFGATLGKYSRAAFGVLLITGIAMVWERYGGVDNMNAWFWVKMALVALLIVLMIVGAVVGPARLNPRVFGLVARLALLGIILSAVLAFA